jgi:hypothetical protein
MSPKAAQREKREAEPALSDVFVFCMGPLDPKRRI